MFSRNAESGYPLDKRRSFMVWRLTALAVPAVVSIAQIVTLL